jgi:hypothetical protein
LKISKGEQTTNCCRTEGTKAGYHKSEESEANGGVEVSMLAIFDLLLEN